MKPLNPNTEKQSEKRTVRPDISMPSMRRLIPAALVASMLSAACGGSSEPPVFVTILTGNTSGVYYPLGVALSQLFRTAIPEANLSVQATAASAENLRLLEAERGELAFTLGDVLADAWEGNVDAGFTTPLRKIRAVATIYPNYIQIVASADSGVRPTDFREERSPAFAHALNIGITTFTILMNLSLSLNYAKRKLISAMK